MSGQVSTRGIGYTKHLDDTLKRNIYDDDIPNWNFIYETSLTKRTDFNVGDKVVLPDGREYRYAKSSAACISGQGCEFTYTGLTAYTTFGVAAAVGDDEVTIAAVAHAALTKDELRGGYICIYVGDTTNNVMFRGIVGNDAAGSGAAIKIYLDGALDQAVVASTSASEVFRNPYNALRTGTSGDRPKAGVPAIKVSAALTYFFVQIKGLIWVAPQANLGNAGGLTGGFWHDVGNVSDGKTALTATIPNAKSCQYAGHVVSGSVSGNGPLFMLQG